MPPHAAAHSIHPRAMAAAPRQTSGMKIAAKYLGVAISGALAALGANMQFGAGHANDPAPQIDTRPITRDELDAKFETVNTKIGAVDDKVTRIDAKLDRVLESRR